MISLNPFMSWEDLVWQSYFSGEDCGFDDVNIVGFYYHTKLGLLVEINVKTMEILRVGVDDEYGFN